MPDPIPSSPFSLIGKVVLQFGGSGALGRALTEAIGRAGAALTVASRDPSAVASGDGIQAERVDLLDLRSIETLCQRVVDARGGLDGMVYNVVSRPMRSCDDPLDKWEESLRLNATGHFATVRACAEAMARRGRGSIVNIASTQGMIGPSPSLYEGTSMSSPPDYFFHKAGMINLTRYFASHYGSRGVRVNAVSPGGIANPDRPLAASFVEHYAGLTMLGRLAEPREIAGAVVFLLSDASSYITGANLPVDGGYTAR